MDLNHELPSMSPDDQFDDSDWEKLEQEEKETSPEPSFMESTQSPTPPAILEYLDEIRAKVQELSLTQASGCTNDLEGKLGEPSELRKSLLDLLGSNENQKLKILNILEMLDGVPDQETVGVASLTQPILGSGPSTSSYLTSGASTSIGGQLGLPEGRQSGMSSLAEVWAGMSRSRSQRDAPEQYQFSIRWEKDEPNGDKATTAAVLYTNERHPQLKITYPVWSERVKQIQMLWRNLSPDDRLEYINRARENRMRGACQPRSRRADLPSTIPVNPAAPMSFHMFLFAPPMPTASSFGAPENALEADVKAQAQNPGQGPLGSSASLMHQQQQLQNHQYQQGIDTTLELFSAWIPKVKDADDPKVLDQAQAKLEADVKAQAQAKALAENPGRQLTQLTESDTDLVNKLVNELLTLKNNPTESNSADRIADIEFQLMIIYTKPMVDMVRDL